MPTFSIFFFCFVPGPLRSVPTGIWNKHRAGSAGGKVNKTQNLKYLYMHVKTFSIRLLMAASLCCGLLRQEAIAQDKTALLKTWNLIRTRNRKDNAIVPNTWLSLKVDEEKMTIEVNRNSAGVQLPYNLENDKLKAKYVTYTIESLTDSTLTLSASDDLRMFFLAEGHSPCGDSLLTKIGDWDGRPYYRATSYLMPLLSGEPLFTRVENAISFKRLKKKVSVSFAFIVDETGAIQGAKILRSYSPEVDAAVLAMLQKSSGKWVAPIACGVPVATALSQTFEYNP